MKAVYVRISKQEMNVIRQMKEKEVIGELEYFIDVISGASKFKDRKDAMRLMADKRVTSIQVKEISRLGRNLRDLLETLEYFTDKGIDIYIENQGLHTMLPNGKTNPTALLIISLLGAIAEQERNLLIERTREGVAIAHANGKYKGRKLGAVNTSEEYERRFGRTICVVQPLFNEGRSVNYVSDFLKQQNTFLDKTTKFKGASRITLEKLIRIGLLTKPTK